MLQNESYGFNTFAAVHIGEIQEGSNPKHWYWVEGKVNIADWTKRGESPDEIGESSLWQKRSSFLQLPESQWPIKQDCTAVDLPEQAKMVMAADIHVEQNLADRIDINHFPSYTKLLRVTLHVLAIYKREPTASSWNVRHMPSA